jgi:hypothetical protein
VKEGRESVCAFISAGLLWKPEERGRENKKAVALELATAL